MDVPTRHLDAVGSEMYAAGTTAGQFKVTTKPGGEPLEFRSQVPETLLRVADDGRILQACRLHMGCGKNLLDGYINIDLARHPGAQRAPEMLCDVALPIALPSGCAIEILAVHLWEHFYRWQCDAVIAEWHRLLRRGGRLILEMPDLIRFCRNIIDGVKGRHEDQLGLWGMYGDPREQNPAMVHKWAWTFRTIEPFLLANGFVDVTQARTEFHNIGRDVRDFRVEAIKA